MINSESREDPLYIKNVVPINNVSDIPITEGYLLLDSGHTSAIIKENGKFLDNRFTIIFQEKSGAGHKYSQINVSQLLDTELVENPNFLSLLFTYADRQIRNDLQGAIVYRDVKDMGEKQKEMYLQSRNIFLVHMNTMDNFITGLENSGRDLTMFSQDIDDIKSLKKWEKDLDTSN